MNQDTVNLLNDIELLYDGAERFTRGEELLEDTVLEIQSALLEARNSLRAFILAQEKESEIKVVYEYKLRPDPIDTKFFDGGLKTVSKNGKSWREQGHVNAAITTWINDVYIPSTQPNNRFIKGTWDYTPEQEAWVEWRKQIREDKEQRAELIPETWTVVAIPVNTKAEIQYINAREFYMKGMIKE